MTVIKCPPVPLLFGRLRLPVTAAMLGRSACLKVLMGAALIAAAPVALGDPTAQLVTNLTVTSVIDTDYGGEVVQVAVSQGVVSGCTYTDAYDITDANIIKGSLALLTAALISGQPVNLFVSGACDSAGRPIVSSVQLGKPVY